MFNLDMRVAAKTLTGDPGTDPGDTGPMYLIHLIYPLGAQQFQLTVDEETFYGLDQGRLYRFTCDMNPLMTPVIDGEDVTDEA